MQKLAIYGNSEKAKLLGVELNLPVYTEKPSYEFLLIVEDEIVSLLDTKEKTNKPFYIDFASGKNIHRKKYGGGRGEDIAKAIGLNKSSQLTILDSTAGLGQDSFVMASLGANITMLERSPIIFTLLQNGLERGQEQPEISDIIKRMTAHNIGAKEYIEQTAKIFDVIYIDPMYPKKEKSALPKKEMVIFRQIVGDDIDSDEILPLALTKAKKRVVVKRPIGAPFLNNTQSSHSINGKVCRFDIYVIKESKIEK